jgi:thioredoxin-related protein
LEREVFSDIRKIKEIEKRYVIVKLKKDKDKIPNFLEVKYYPSTYLLKSDGTIVDEIPGYVKSSDFIEFIEEVYKQEKKFL